MKRLADVEAREEEQARVVREEAAERKRVKEGGVRLRRAKWIGRSRVGRQTVENERNSHGEARSSQLCPDESVTVTNTFNNSVASAIYINGSAEEHRSKTQIDPLQSGKPGPKRAPTSK